ncbi:hypothetical protein ALC53_03802, partial [Atta colombica]
ALNRSSLPFVAPDFGPTLGSGSELGSVSDLGSGSDFGSGTELGSGSDFGSGSELELGSGSDFGSGSELGSGSDFGCGSELGSGSDFGSGSELGSGSDFGSGSEVDSSSEVVSCSITSLDSPTCFPVQQSIVRRANYLLIGAITSCVVSRKEVIITPTTGFSRVNLHIAIKFLSKRATHRGCSGHKYLIHTYQAQRLRMILEISFCDLKKD